MRILQISTSAQRATLRLTYISRMKTDGHLTPEPAATANLATPVAALKPPVAKARIPQRRLVIGGIAIVALALAGYHFYPTVVRMLNTVSTDDAYVNGHVTFVAARVPGQVVKVLVDDNNRVKKGDILIQLDKQPFQIDVAFEESDGRHGTSECAGGAKTKCGRWSPRRGPIASSCNTRSKT